ncbi:MAG: thioredoxin domain-containing protein [Desulfobulbaceae bacterium]|nr:thioredoxin domain-containing protein [Desulfobulbaceae bacterium]
MKYILVAAFLFLATACSNEDQAGTSSQPGVTASEQTAKEAVLPEPVETLAYKLVFFLNPNGGPCRMQDAILGEMADELRGKVGIQYVKTTIPANRKIFSQYGIRALPTLILADADGKEIKRMTPGVKRAEDVRALIQSIPQT